MKGYTHMVCWGCDVSQLLDEAGRHCWNCGRFMSVGKSFWWMKTTSITGSAATV